MKRIFATIAAAISLAATAVVHAQSNFEAEQQLAQGRRILDQINQLDIALTSQMNAYNDQCVMSIGNKTLCRCLAHTTPMSIDFRGYIAITSQTRAELGYDRLSDDDKKTYQAVVSARDQCVTTRSAKK